MSTFNYQVNCVFAANITFATFYQNYYSFISQVATAAGVGINQVLVQNITNGSVIVNMQIVSQTSPGSSNSVNAQNNLNTLFKGPVAGMAVSSSTITPNANNSPSSSGLSDTTIIILATVIPIGTLCNFYFI
jgi:Rod binding domain-containing protein